MPLSSSDLAQAAMAFDLFDKDRDGLCTRQELGLAMRACNQTPSEATLAKIFEKYELPEPTSTFDQKAFTAILNEFGETKSPNEAEDLREAFRVFDRNDDGTIQLAELRYVLTNLGEKMNEDEVNELVQVANATDPKTGLIQYEKLIKLILS